MRRLLLSLAITVPLEAEAAALMVDLQPVRVCTAEGCPEPSFHPRYLKRIWAQADVRVKVRRPVSGDLLDIDTDATGDLDASDALYDFAFWQMDQGLRPGTAYMGFTWPFAGSTLGMAFVNGPELVLYPYGVSETLEGRFGAAVVAHELGHILGARHDTGVSLMSPVIARSDYDDRRFLPAIDGDALDAIRTSPLLAPASVPLPPAGAALAGALLVLIARKLRTGRPPRALPLPPADKSETTLSARSRGKAHRCPRPDMRSLPARPASSVAP